MDDVKFIAKVLKISETDWLKYKLTVLIIQDKQRIMEKLEKKYIKGLITDNEFFTLTKLYPSKLLREEREIKHKQKIIDKYVCGKITEAEYEQETGSSPTNSMKKLKRGIAKAPYNFVKEAVKNFETAENGALQ